MWNNSNLTACALLILVTGIAVAVTSIRTQAQPTTQPEATKPVTAYVWEYQDQWTKKTGAAELLKEAGFDVKPLPMDSSPWGLSGLVFIGSFVSDSPDYKAYMNKYREDLYKFVDDGNVLVQMAQADQTEPNPPFLPTTQAAHRCDIDSEVLYVLSPEHHLVQGMKIKDGKLESTGMHLGWELFDQQGGFEVILSADTVARYPALMEGAYGQGRIVLAAMSLDKLIDEQGNRAVSADRDELARQFAANLLKHVRAVDARKAPAIQVTPSPRDRREFVDGAWTLVLLPDTQVYSVRYPGLFSAQTAWIREHVNDRDIKYVLHLGDITDNNTITEWERASASMRLLDSVVPYAIVPGNHDYGPSGDASTRDTYLNDYFSYETSANMPTFGGAYKEGELDNTYHLFEAGGDKWIIIALEWGPRDEVVEWANGVMAKYPDRKGILITHAFLFSNSRRYDHTDPSHPNSWNPHNYRTPQVNDGQELWDKLVRKHNFVFTFNGHVLNDGTGYRADPNDNGTLVHQVLANYQMRELGGEAYLRLVEFQPDGNTVYMVAYSPLHDRFMLEPDQSFTIKLDEAPADQPGQKQ